tara:strand:- start:3157 stop:3339 length:183 start_codon:yes stop_codon:yes gene_type:complete
VEQVKVFGKFFIGIIIGLFSLGSLSIILSIFLEKDREDFAYLPKVPKASPLENFDDFLDD